MSEAVKTINRISDPDFSNTFLLQRIEAKGFGHYSSYSVEGFSIENAFRLLAPHDFDGALLLAKSLEDKALGAMATLALSAACSDAIEKPQKQKPAKPAARDNKKRNP